MNPKLLSDLGLGGPGDLRSDLRPSEVEVLPEGLDVLLGVLGGHVGVVWRANRALVGCGRAKRALGCVGERSEPARGLAVAAEGSGLRVIHTSLPIVLTFTFIYL